MSFLLMYGVLIQNLNLKQNKTIKKKHFQLCKSNVNNQKIEKYICIENLNLLLTIITGNNVSPQHRNLKTKLKLSM